MLELMVKGVEGFDNDTQEFKDIIKPTKLCLEHSLVSISKWEMKYKKPFLGKEEKTKDEMIDYIKCMTITQNVPDDVYDRLDSNNYIEIKKYIEDGMSATWFKNENQKHSSRIITSEVIYYWMVANQIPFECQKWHLNRLLTLIRVCGEEGNKKPMKKSDVLKNQAALNKARRKPKIKK